MLMERLSGSERLAGPPMEPPSELPYLQQPMLVLMSNNSSAGLTPTEFPTFTSKLSTSPGNHLRITELLRPLSVCTTPTDRRRIISASAAPTLTTKVVHLQPVPPLPLPPAPAVNLCLPLCRVQHRQKTRLRSIATLSTTPEDGFAPTTLSTVPPSTLEDSTAHVTAWSRSHMP